MMIHLFALVVCVYVLWRLLWPLAIGKRTKYLLSGIALLISQQHLIIRNFFGSLASPELPYTVVLLLGGLFGTFVFLLFALLLRDVLNLFLSRVCRGHWALQPLQPRAALGWLVSALVLAFFGVWQAARVPEVRTLEIVLPRLPAELDGLRIVQLTDLHASKLFQRAWMQAVVDQSNALKPDLILITGDLADGTPQARAQDVAPLQGLKARLGVFAVPGNHEYYTAYQDWLTAFSGLGLRMLLNEHVLIRERNQMLLIAGVTDPAAARIGAAAPDVQAALAGAPKEALKILMDHQPRHAARNAAAGLDLQLSGHTHGGQILGLHYVTQAANAGFVSGLYSVGDMQLFVSNGTGLWPGFPLRLGVPAEIVQLVLRVRA